MFPLFTAIFFKMDMVKLEQLKWAKLSIIGVFLSYQNSQLFNISDYFITFFHN